MQARVLANTKLLEDNVVPFRFRVDNLTFLVAFILTAAILVIYGFYGLQGRFTTYFPTITEVAVSSPNCMIFSSVVSVTAFLGFLILNVLLTWGEVYGVFGRKFVIFGYIASFLSPLLLVVTANFSLYDSLRADYYGGMPFSIVTFLFFLALFVKMFREVRPAMKVVRIILLVCGGVALILSLVPMPASLPWEKGCSLRAICQAVFGFLMIVFFVTFRQEISRLKVDLLIFTDDY